MAADSTIRPVHGGYQDAFDAANLLPLAREIAAQQTELRGDHVGWLAANTFREGKRDDSIEVGIALAVLKWRFYAEPDFRAAVTR